MKLIIQIPCYNEAETLQVALDHLPRQIDGVDEIEPFFAQIFGDQAAAGVHEMAAEAHFAENMGLVDQLFPVQLSVP